MKKHIALLISGIFASTAFAANTDSGDSKDSSKKFEDALKEEVPLSAQQVTKTRSIMDEVSRAEAERLAPRNPRIRDITVRVGENKLNKIYMSEGMSTIVSFYDANGNPLNVNLPGAIIGDKKSISNESMENKVILSVQKPWLSTNLQVPLEGVPDFIPFTVTSEKDPSAIDQVDYQIRVRLITGAQKVIDKKDTYDLNTLIGMVNGLKIGKMAPINIMKSEVKMDASSNWLNTNTTFASFHLGNDGLTYLVLDPGYKLVRNTDILASQIGSDGSSGYIIGGNNPRIFNIINQSNGAWYKITLSR